jgi:hypothetical protein
VRYRLTGAGLSPAGSRQLRLTHRNRKFESISLQQRVVCEPDFLAFDRRALKAHPLRARCHRAYPATLRRRWPSSRF